MRRTNKFFALLLVLSIALACTPLSVLAGDSTPSYWRSVTGSRDDGVFLFPIRNSDGGVGAITDWAGCPGSGTCALCGDTHLGWAGCAQYHTGGYGHQGMDIGVGYKDVLAPADGTVYWSSTNWSGRGYTVIMEHPIGNGYSYYSVFQHLSKVDVVSSGTHVTVGTKIAVSGNSTGGSDSSSGAHLHFGMVIDTSGRGNTLAQNANYDSGLLGVENKGWVTSGTGGTGSGRIVVNPMHADGYLEAPLIDGTWSMRSHCGSIKLTYDTSKVTPRPYNATELTITGQTYPTGTLSVGSYFDLYGVVSAPDTIRNVTVGVFDRNGQLTSEIKQINPNSTSFDVHSIDTEIKFNNLSAGYYTYKVIAATTKETKTLVASDFTVGSPSGSAYDPYDYVPSATIVENGHVYSLYEYYMPWHDAKAFCELRGGHLMTVTSSAEQDVLYKLMNMGSTNKAWLGATDVEKEGTWKWITGESFSFVNWNDDEPNNSSSCEHYAHAIKSSGLWNDVPIAASDTAFILEVDVNLSSINSLSENGFVRYELYKSKMPWTEAKAYCEAIGGHLVTITSDAETNNINSLLSGHTAEKSRIWLGATDRATEGNWKWVTGEQWSYTNWGNGQPDNDTGGENYLEIRTEYSNTWNDSHNYNTTALDWYFICEYEPASYTVTFKDWDGTVLKTQTVEHGSSATAPANPTRSGYVFTGWDKDFSNVTSNMTVTAQYKKISIVGDANGDSLVNTLDAVMILRYVAGWNVEPDMTAADVDGNGSVNTLDAVYILRYVAGWELPYFD